MKSLLSSVIHQRLLLGRIALGTGALVTASILLMSHTPFSEAEKSPAPVSKPSKTTEKAEAPAETKAAMTPRERLKETAYAHTKKQEWAKAEALYQELYALDKAQNDGYSIELASDLSALGNLSYRLGNLEKAEGYFQEAMLMQENLLGGDHPDTIATLNNLALVYEAENKGNEAETLYKRAIQIAEAKGDKPLQVLALANLSGWYIDQNQYQSASFLLKRAIRVIDGDAKKPAMGSKKPYKTLTQKRAYFAGLAKQPPKFYSTGVFAAMTNLAEVYRHDQDYDMAEVLYKRALLVAAKTMPPNDPNLIVIHRNLADIYKQTGNDKEAEFYNARARELEQGVISTQHPDSQTTPHTQKISQAQP